MDSIQDTDMSADQLCTEGNIAGNVRDNVKGCLTRPEKTRMEAIPHMEVSPGSFQTFTDALQLDKSNDTVAPLLTGKKVIIAPSHHFPISMRKCIC